MYKLGEDGNFPLLNIADIPSPAKLADSPESVSTVTQDDKPFDQGLIKLSEKEIAEIWRKIDTGEAHKKQVFYPVYKVANQLFRGEHWPEGSKRSYWEGQLVINIIPNTIKSLVEAVAYQDPDFTIHPWSNQGEKVQDIAKSIVRYYWREAHAQKQLKFMAWDSKMYGYGVGQVGWLFVTEDIRMNEGRLEVLPEGIEGTDVELAEQAGLLKPGETAEDFVPEDEVIEDRFQVKRLNPMDFLVPPGATSVVDDWPWCAKINRRPLSEVKKDRRFRHSKRKHNTILSTADLNGTTKLTEPYEAYEAYLPDDIGKLDDDRRPADTKYVELVEYYERDRRIHVILCRDDRSKYLLAEKWSWESKKYPFVTIHNTHTPDEFYGKSVPYEMWSIQINANESYSQTMEHRRQFNRMYQAPNGSLEEKAKTALMDGQPGSIISYNPEFGMNPIAQIPHLQLQPEVYTSLEQSNKGAELISGLSQYQVGDAPTKRMSATESHNIQNAHGILFMADAQAFVSLCKQVGEHLLEWAQQFAPVVRNLPIFDDQGKAKEWIDFTGDQIRGDWLVEIWPESTQPPNVSSDLQQNQAIVNILIKAAEISQQFGGQLPRPFAIVFREGLRIIGARHIDELMPLPPEQAPLSVDLAQQQALPAGVANGTQASPGQPALGLPAQGS